MSIPKRSGSLIREMLEDVLKYNPGVSQVASWRVCNYWTKSLYYACHCHDVYERQFEFDIEYTTKRGRVGKATIILEDSDIREITEQFVREIFDLDE